MTRAVPSILTILLLNSLATLQAADAKGFTLVERHGRTGLLTPKGKPFIMLGISSWPIFLRSLCSLLFN